MKDSAVKYAVRGLIKATHVALSKGRENQDSFDSLAGTVDEIAADIEPLSAGFEELKDQLPDLVTEEFGNFDMSEAVSEQLSDYGIYSEDWKDDIKDDIASALAECEKEARLQEERIGSLERKIGGPTVAEPASSVDMSDLIDAVQKLYELNGMALNFDLGDK